MELLELDSNTWNHLTVQIKLLALDSNTWNHLTVCQQISSGLFNMLPTNIYNLI